MAMSKKLSKEEIMLIEDQLREFRPDVHSNAVKIAAERKARRDEARTVIGKEKKAAERQKQLFREKRRGETPKVRGFNPRRGGFESYDD